MSPITRRLTIRVIKFAATLMLFLTLIAYERICSRQVVHLKNRINQSDYAYSLVRTSLIIRGFKHYKVSGSPYLFIGDGHGTEVKYIIPRLFADMKSNRRDYDTFYIILPECAKNDVELKDVIEDLKSPGRILIADVNNSTFKNMYDYETYSRVKQYTRMRHDNFLRTVVLFELECDLVEPKERYVLSSDSIEIYIPVTDGMYYDISLH